MELNNRFIGNFPDIVIAFGGSWREEIWAHQYTFADVYCNGVTVIFAWAIAIGGIESPIGSSRIGKSVFHFILREVHQQVIKLGEAAHLPLLVGNSVGTISFKSDCYWCWASEPSALDILLIVIFSLFLSCYYFYVNSLSLESSCCFAFLLVPELKKLVSTDSELSVAIRSRNSNRWFYWRCNRCNSWFNCRK